MNVPPSSVSCLGVLAFGFDAPSYLKGVFPGHMSEDADTGAPTDAELVIRLRARDAQAFATLFEVYFEALTRFAYYMLGSRDMAKDVVQDVFVRIWERPEAKLDPRRPVKQYLYTSVRNRVLDERKREGGPVASSGCDARYGGDRYLAVGDT